MPRAKEYATAAERQAAYRARHREQEPPLQGYLAALARTLQGELQATAAAGKSPVPPELIVARADHTLRNLIRYLRALREEGEAGPKALDGKGGESAPDNS